MDSTQFMKFKQELITLQKKLATKALKKGLTENFGQKEIAEVREKWAKRLDTNSENRLRELQTWCEEIDIPTLARLRKEGVV